MMTKIIAIDGIHRSGKNTQLTLLQEKIQQLGYEVFTLRGEYYREGNGDNTLTDPQSLWWQEHKGTDQYDLKSQRLQRELYHFLHKKLPIYCKTNNIEKSVVLLERSIVGRYLFKYAEGESCDGIDNFQYGHHEKYRQNTVVPDLIFVLQPSKEEILQRLYSQNKDTPIQGQDTLSNNDRNTVRHNYKIDYIPQKYDKYYAGLEIIPDHIKNHIHTLQSDENVSKIHKNIREKTKKVLMGN